MAAASSNQLPSSAELSGLNTALDDLERRVADMIRRAGNADDRVITDLVEVERLLRNAQRVLRGAL